MRKKEIIEYILDTVNDRDEKQHNLNRDDIDAVILAFRDALLLSLSKCEEFVYHNFLDGSSRVERVLGGRNPKTQEPLPESYKIRHKIKLSYRADRFLKDADITEEAKENTIKQYKEIRSVGK